MGSERSSRTLRRGTSGTFKDHTPLRRLSRETTATFKEASQTVLSNISSGNEAKRHKIIGQHGLDATSTRYRLGAFLVSPMFEGSLLCAILANFVFLIIETDSSADPYPRGEDPTRGPPALIRALNYVLSIIYVLELAVKIFVMRTALLRDSESMLDAFIVAVDWIMVFLDWIMGGMPRITVLRCFRLVRVTRMFKAMAMFKELNYLLRGFASALKAIFWGLIMVVVALIMWSILAVQVIHPVNRRVAFETNHYDGCLRCPHAFESVWASFNTFWQTLVAGDSWGAVALPIIEIEPLAFVFFAMVLVTVSLAIMNLILAVIVDAGQNAREAAIMEREERQKAEYAAAVERFALLCKELDVDGSGLLSVEELERGYENPLFRETMDAMDVPMHDVKMVVNAIDKHGTGSVSQEEFLAEIQTIRQAHLRKLVCCLRFAVADLGTQLQELTASVRQGRPPPERAAPAALEPRSPKEHRGEMQIGCYLPLRKDVAEEKATCGARDVDSVSLAGERLAEAIREIQRHAAAQRQVAASIDCAVSVLARSQAEAAPVPPAGTSRSARPPAGSPERRETASGAAPLEAADFAVRERRDELPMAPLLLTCR